MKIAQHTMSSLAHDEEDVLGIFLEPLSLPEQPSIYTGDGGGGGGDNPSNASKVQGTDGGRWTDWEGGDDDADTNLIPATCYC